MTRVLGATIRGFAWAVTGVLALVASTLVHLDSAPGRRAVCAEAEHRVSTLLEGTLKLARCETLRLEELRLEGVSLRDPDGREVARVGALSVRPDLRALLGGTIRMRAVRIEEPRASLATHEGELAVVKAVELAEPAEETPEPQGEPTRVVIDRIRVTEGAVTDLPQQMSVRGLEVDVELVIEEGVEVPVRRLEARVEREGKPVARLAKTDGTLRLIEGAESHVAMRVAAGRDHADLEADVRWGANGPAHLDAKANVSVSPALLARLGQNTAAAQLRSPLDVKLHAAGAPDDLRVDGTVRTAGGQVALEGHYAPPRLEAGVETRDLDLGAVTPATAALVGGRVDATVTSVSRPEGARRIEVRATDLRYAQWHVPEVSTQVLVASDYAHVQSLSIPHLTRGGGKLAVDARIGFDGTADAEVVARFPRLSRDPNLRRVVPGAAGRLAVDVRAELKRDGAVDAGGRVSLRDAHLPGAQVGQLDVRGEVRGRFPTPAADVSIDGRDIAVGERRIDDVRVSVEGQAGRYDLAGRVMVREGPRVAFDLGANVAPDRYAFSGSTTVDAWWPARVVARFDEIVVHPDHGVQVGRLRVRGEGVELTAHGEYRFAGRSELTLRLDALDLASVAQTLDLGGGVRGNVSLRADAQGTLRAPHVQLEMAVQDVGGPGLPSLDATVNAMLERRDASVSFEVRNEQGTLVSSKADAEIDAAALAAGADPRGILDRPWSASVHVPQRRLDALPPPARVDMPLVAGMDVKLAGGPGPMRGDVEAALQWMGGMPDSACGEVGAPRVTATVKLRDHETEVSVTGRIDAREVLTAAVSARTPVGSWLRNGFPARLPAVDARVDIPELALREVPVVCEHGSGRIAAQVQARRLLTSQPRANVRVEARDLDFGGPVANWTLEAEANADSGQVRGHVETGGRRVMELHARAPLSVSKDGMGIRLARAPFEADVTLDRTPVAALAAPVPVVARPAGFVNGSFHASGTGPEDLDVRGELQLEEVSLTVRDPFIRLHEVGGRIAINRRRVAIEGLTTHDRDGTVRVDGTVALEQWRPTRLDMRVRVDKYPVRNEGIILATLDGDIRIDGRLDTRPRRIDVKLTEMAVVLPDQMARDVQQLDQHPEVIYEGQPGFDRSLGVAESLARHRGQGDGTTASQEPPADAVPMVLDIESPTPFWVRRSDFAIQVALDLQIRSEGADTVMQGPVKIRRGFITVLGKTFEFQQGRISFAGALPVDPSLDLTAVHELPSGYDVTLHVGGTLGAPELTFSSTDPNANTDAKIIALLMGVRGQEEQGQQDAKGQTRSMLAGMMAGLVGTLARRGGGQVIPTLAVESGGTAQSTRVRAGFQMDSLIPESWRGVVRGLYLEGQVGGGGAQRGASTRAGFLLELFFPYDLSTEASYEQPDNWSLDLLWEP